MERVLVNIGNTITRWMNENIKQPGFTPFHLWSCITSCKKNLNKNGIQLSSTAD